VCVCVCVFCEMQSTGNLAPTFIVRPIAIHMLSGVVYLGLCVTTFVCVTHRGEPCKNG